MAVQTQAVQTQQISEEEAVRALVVYIAEQMKAGCPNSAIEADLIENGVEREAAHALVKQVSDARFMAQSEARERGQSNMSKGALWFIGGSLVTLVTLADGGGFLLAYGAIIGGAVQFLVGWRQSKA